MKGIAAAFVPLALVLAGCGAAETADQPHKPEKAIVVRAQLPFTKHASTICAGMQDGAGVVTGGRKPTDAEFRRLLARWRAGFDRLARLDPPRSQAKQFRRMLSHYRTMTAALAAAQASDDESVLGDIAAAVVEGTRGSRAARHAGVARCAFFAEIKQPPRDPEPALAATRALVPTGARVRKADTDECNGEASCRVEFSGNGSTAARLRAAVRALRAHGWTHARIGRSPTGSTWAMAYRNDYEVMIELLGTRRPPHCARAREGMFGCSDSVWVHRVEIPEVLTGG